MPFLCCPSSCPVHEGPGAASPAPNAAATLQGDPRHGPRTPASAVLRRTSQYVQHVAQLLDKPHKTWTFHTKQWTRGWAEVRNVVKFQSACSGFKLNKGPFPPSHRASVPGSAVTAPQQVRGSWVYKRTVTAFTSRRLSSRVSGKHLHSSQTKKKSTTWYFSSVFSLFDSVR